MNLSTVGEFALIERLAARLAGRGITPAAGSVLLGISDDAAVLGLPSGTELVATMDALVEEVHFRRDWSRPEDLGWKSLAVNVSDLGAMGARPVAALVSLGVPPDVPVKWIDRLYAGLAECAAEYGCPIVGGDTVRSPRAVVLSVTAIGSAAEGKAVRRSGARLGDRICVTGVLGESGAALALLERGERKRRPDAPLYDRHFRPRPPAPAGAALAEAGLATAMLDLSDGLASDLRHLAARSGIGARVEAARLPISDAARQAAARLDVDPEEWALHGGEDYQLLFTVSPNRWPEVPSTLGPLGVVATVIGEVAEGEVVLVGADGKGRALKPRGFAHFRASAGDRGKGTV